MLEAGAGDGAADFLDELGAPDEAAGAADVGVGGGFAGADFVDELEAEGEPLEPAEEEDVAPAGGVAFTIPAGGRDELERQFGGPEGLAGLEERDLEEVGNARHGGPYCRLRW